VLTVRWSVPAGYGPGQRSSSVRSARSVRGRGAGGCGWRVAVGRGGGVGAWRWGVGVGLARGGGAWGCGRRVAVARGDAVGALRQRPARGVQNARKSHWARHLCDISASQALMSRKRVTGGRFRAFCTVPRRFASCRASVTPLRTCKTKPSRRHRGGELWHVLHGARRHGAGRLRDRRRGRAVGLAHGPRPGSRGRAGAWAEAGVARSGWRRGRGRGRAVGLAQGPRPGPRGRTGAGAVRRSCRRTVRR
jgi:hypothetical protein